MSVLLFSNNAQTTLAGAITNTATTLNVQSGAGALFPNPGSGQYFVASLVDAATGALTEIIWVTARVGDTFTIVRAQEGTTALNWLAGDSIGNFWTAGQAAQMLQQGQAPTITATEVIYYGVDTGVADSIVVTTTPTISTYTDGMVFEVTPAATNLTSTPGINICSLGVRSIVHSDGTSVLPGEIVIGAKIMLAYSGAIGKMVILSPTQRLVQNIAQNNATNWAGTFGGTVNALTASLSPNPISLTNGMIVYGVTSGLNTSAATLNVNGIGVKPIVRSDNVALAGGELNGVVALEYDGTSFRIISMLPLAFISANVSTPITTSAVLTAISGATVGAVGTYAFLQSKTYPVSMPYGTNVAGSSLYFGGISANISTSNNEGVLNEGGQTGGSSVTASGTWKVMGNIPNVNANNYIIGTLFLRVA